MRASVVVFLLVGCSNEPARPHTEIVSQPVISCVGYDASLPPRPVDLEGGPDPDAVYAPFMSGTCPTPPSVCVDSDWNAFFDNARCVQNRCVWDVKFFRCPNGCVDQGEGGFCKGCQFNRCNANQGGPTAPPPERN